MTFMNRLAVWGLTAFAALAPAQKQALEKGPHRMEIVLEQRSGDEWVVRDPGHVFENGDRVRFRLTTNFAGYLYVITTVRLISGGRPATGCRKVG